MLPAEAYTSPAVLAWERRHFFAASWVCVGRVADLLPEGRTQVACTAGDVAVLLSRDASGAVRAFANTCRHRGHELLAEGETSGKRAVVCPYHAWSYDLEGCLLAAPGFRDVAAFDPGQHGLVSLPVEVWHGWVFVNGLGSPATPFAEHLGGLAGLVAPYAPERLVLRATHDYVVAANWKVITENYHECYHCPLIHPELCQVSPPTSGSNYDLPGGWVGGSMDLRDDAVTMSLDGRSAGRPIDGAHPRRVLYLGLLPNLLLSMHPDYVMTHRMTPLSPGQTRVECALVLPGRGRRPGLRRRLLGPDQPAGLGGLRVGAARAVVAALRARPAGTQRGRGAQVRHDDRPGLPGRPPADLAGVRSAARREPAHGDFGEPGRGVGQHRVVEGRARRVVVGCRLVVRDRAGTQQEVGARHPVEHEGHVLGAAAPAPASR